MYLFLKVYKVWLGAESYRDIDNVKSCNYNCIFKYIYMTIFGCVTHKLIER